MVAKPTLRSTLTFLAAFGVMCFHLPTADTSTRVVLSVSGVISISLISWCVVTFRPKSAKDCMDVVSIFDGSQTSLWKKLWVHCPTVRIEQVSDLEKGNEEKIGEA
jgi:hypothetical protein